MKRFIGLTVVSIIFCGGYIALKHILNTTDYYAKVTLENKTSSVTRSTPNSESEYVYFFKSSNSKGEIKDLRLRADSLREGVYIMAHVNYDKIVRWNIVEERSVPPKALEKIKL